jgi:uncharacterized membrane protein
MKNLKIIKCFSLIIVFVVFELVYLFHNHSSGIRNYYNSYKNSPVASSTKIIKSNFDIIQDYLRNDIIDFEKFDNFDIIDNRGAERRMIVPNIVHLIYLIDNESALYTDFIKMICIYSIYLNQNPDRIYIHCEDCSFRGDYWDQIKLKLKNVIRFQKIPKFRSIYETSHKVVQHR